MIGIDVHVHTNSSSDSFISPRALVNALRTHPRVNCVAITDHDSLRGYERTKELSRQYEDEILVIPGVEVSTERGHLILLGVEEAPRAPLPLEELVDFAREREALILMPHPFRSGTGIANHSEASVKADAVEVLNPRFTRAEVRMSLTLAKLLGATPVAGSDCHRLEEFAACYTRIDATLNIDSVLGTLRSGSTRPVCTVRLKG